MDKESRALKHDMFKLAWYMRGGINIEQIYQMDRSEREIIGDIIAQNLETTKETRLPFF
jgi:hypothetical protein